MNMVMIVYDAGSDEAVRETLEGCDTQGFTLWQRVLGRAQRSDPRMDDAVWPGYNNVLMVAVESGPGLERVLVALSERHAQMGGKGLKVFTWPLEAVV